MRSTTVSVPEWCSCNFDTRRTVWRDWRWQWDRSGRTREHDIDPSAGKDVPKTDIYHVTISGVTCGVTKRWKTILVIGEGHPVSYGTCLIDGWITISIWVQEKTSLKQRETQTTEEVSKREKMPLQWILKTNAQHDVALKLPRWPWPICRTGKEKRAPPLPPPPPPHTFQYNPEWGFSALRYKIQMAVIANVNTVSIWVQEKTLLKHAYIWSEKTRKNCPCNWWRASRNCGTYSIRGSQYRAECKRRSKNKGEGGLAHAIFVWRHLHTLPDEDGPGWRATHTKKNFHVSKWTTRRDIQWRFCKFTSLCAHERRNTQNVLCEYASEREEQRHNRKRKRTFKNCAEPWEIMQSATKQTQTNCPRVCVEHGTDNTSNSFFCRKLTYIPRQETNSWVYFRLQKRFTDTSWKLKALSTSNWIHLRRYQSMICEQSRDKQSDADTNDTARPDVRNQNFSRSTRAMSTSRMSCLKLHFQCRLPLSVLLLNPSRASIVTLPLGGQLDF